MIEKLRQDEIELEESTHQYKVHKVPHLKFTSATTFVNQFFEAFNAQKIANKLADNDSGKYANMNSTKQILRSWKKISDLGTKVHKEIEDYILTRGDILPTEDKARHGVNWLEENIHKSWELYPEVRLYSINLQIAGTTDLLIRNPETDQWVIVDWKTNNKIATTAFKGKKGTHYATRLLPDCKFNKYALQLSLYRYILEKYYDIEIHKSFIIQLRKDPTVYYPLGIKQMETPYLKPNIEKMIMHRLQQKEDGTLFKGEAFK